jgi:TPP-dependent indolepyruvate ferredoxin oxidoreductase alpha subunit
MMMMWGAQLVTVCTAAMWYGWENISKQVQGMEKYLEKMGYSDYSQIVGKSLQYLRSSSDLEALDGWAAVDREKCIGCGKCEKPAHCEAVTIVNKKSVIDPSKCLGCGICASLCPTKAISMHIAE